MLVCRGRNPLHLLSEMMENAYRKDGKNLLGLVAEIFPAWKRSGSHHKTWSSMTLPR